jgi:hypothetical protein
MVNNTLVNANKLEITIDVTYSQLNKRTSGSSTNIKGIRKEASITKLEKSITIKAIYEKREKNFKQSVASSLSKHLKKGWVISACRLSNEHIFPDYCFISKYLERKLYEETVDSIVNTIAFVVRRNSKEYFKENAI